MYLNPCEIGELQQRMGLKKARKMVCCVPVFLAAVNKLYWYKYLWEQILGETKVYQQSLVILLWSNVRNTQ